MTDLIVIQPQVTELTVTEDVNQVVVSSVGVQGPKGDTGATGATGAQGPSGVIAVTAPITNSGTSTSANIGVSAGSTSAAGVLQLTDSTSSTSTTTAATPNAVKTAYDLAVLRAPVVKRQSGTYFNSPMVISTAGFTIQHNRTYYAPIYIDQSTTVDRITLRTGSTFSGTATVRLGIYNHDQSTGLPSTVLLDAGTVSATAAATNYEITISQALSTGYYWVVMAQQGTAPTVSNYLANSTGGSVNLLMQTITSPASSANMGYFQNSVTGAFATAGTLSSAQSMPLVYLRIA